MLSIFDSMVQKFEEEYEVELNEEQRDSLESIIAVNIVHQTNTAEALNSHIDDMEFEALSSFIDGIDLKGHPTYPEEADNNEEIFEKYQSDFLDFQTSVEKFIYSLTNC